MIRNRLVVVFNLSLLVVFLGCGRGAEEARTAIQAAYARMDTALQQKDIGTVMATLAPGYEHSSEKGFIRDVNAEQQYWQDIFAHSTSIQIKTSVQKVSLDGDEATVTTKQSFTRRYAIPATGQPGEFHADYTNQDVWVNSDNKWLLKSSQIQTTSKTRNGQPTQ